MRLTSHTNSKIENIMFDLFNQNPKHRKTAFYLGVITFSHSVKKAFLDLNTKPLAPDCTQTKHHVKQLIQLVSMGLLIRKFNVAYLPEISAINQTITIGISFIDHFGPIDMNILCQTHDFCFDDKTVLEFDQFDNQKHQLEKQIGMRTQQTGRFGWAEITSIIVLDEIQNLN